MKRTFITLKARVSEAMSAARSRLLRLEESRGDIPLPPITLSQMVGGMRSLTLLTETSKLDSIQGIRFRGRSLRDCLSHLPQKNFEPLPEAMLYLLLSGEIPTERETEEVRQELAGRGGVPPTVEKMMFGLPKGMHPMTQLSIGVLALQPYSKFLRQYEENTISKLDYWKPTFEDALDLIAKLPRLASIIYRHTYKDGKIVDFDPSLDLSQNFALMLGYPSEAFIALIRLYLTLHSDHEGGNVSAHATHLVGSSLADAYLAYSAGLNGLAGPRHGLASQECLRFLMEMQRKLGGNPSEEAVGGYVRGYLKAGMVVPGYGNSVLRVIDPRFEAERAFAHRMMPDDSLCKLIDICSRVIPGELEATGNVKNPWPNVDAHSGALLYHYGLTEFDFYTVVFGVSRAMGCLSSLVWSRGLMLPMERPESVTLDWLEAQVNYH